MWLTFKQKVTELFRPDFHDGDSRLFVAVEDGVRDRGSSSPARQQTSVNVQDSPESQNNKISIKIPTNVKKTKNPKNVIKFNSSISMNVKQTTLNFG